MAIPPSILAALKKHHVPCYLFVVGNFLQDNPDLIKQMQKEGHTVGNHTYHHPDMSQIATQETFSKKSFQMSKIFSKKDHRKVDDTILPAASGKYNTEKSTDGQKIWDIIPSFWSLAYVDWLTDAQPSKEEAFDKLLGRIHPGAIVLLHNTSKTNGEILDELLNKWESMGYQFSSLKDLLKTEE